MDSKFIKYLHKLTLPHNFCYTHHTIYHTNQHVKITLKPQMENPNGFINLSNSKLRLENEKI